MISAKLRDALSVAAMVVMVGGPLLATVSFAAAAALGEGTGLALGNTLKVFFSSLIAGGVLRLLVSIDARLEAKV